MREIEYTFKDGSKHVIPDTNQANFERIFDKDIASQRSAGQNKPEAYKPKAPAAPVVTKTEKEIIHFPLEEPSSPTAIAPAKEEPVAAVEDEVIIIEETT